MLLKINGVEIAAYPKPGGFKVTPMDMDDADATFRAADASFQRDRVAVKRQIEMEFNPLPWDKVSSILKAMIGQDFEFYYPDTMEGDYVTKTFYVGNRPATAAIEKDGVLWWDGLQMTLTEI